jgi:septal ring factor EnvC (AmiA/AmiB activator)
MQSLNEGGFQPQRTTEIQHTMVPPSKSQREEEQEKIHQVLSNQVSLLAASVQKVADFTRANNQREKDLEDHLQRLTESQNMLAVNQDRMLQEDERIIQFLSQQRQQAENLAAEVHARAGLLQSEASQQKFQASSGMAAALQNIASSAPMPLVDYEQIQQQQTPYPYPVSGLNQW